VIRARNDGGSNRTSNQQPATNNQQLETSNQKPEKYHEKTIFINHRTIINHISQLPEQPRFSDN
jgi:hypothetical protein